jgi:imidazolonepropionase-like amidohydrolase
VNGDLLIRGARVLDVGTGEAELRDLAISGGLVTSADALSEPEEVDASGLTACFGLWDVHCHPGSLMYDRTARGYFEGAAEWTVRAVANLQQAASMGITGVRALGEADGVDVALRRAFAEGELPGPRLSCARQPLRTTGGHGTAYPRRHLGVRADLVCDGPTEFRRAVRTVVEGGADWVKVLLTGGLYSPHETVDGAQIADDELKALMAAAKDRGVPVSAHCGGSALAIRFSELGGRSVEHGYALDEAAAAAMAANGTWLVPTIGVTHDVELMERDQWPAHAKERAIATAKGHGEAVLACLEAGVKLAVGADLNPSGPRLHAELRLLERLGIDRLTLLRAASCGARELCGLGAATVPQPGSAADLIMLDTNPLDGLETLATPRGVLSFGRFLVRPDGCDPRR